MVRARVALSGLPMRFEVNAGQWKHEVRYAGRSGAGTVFFTQNGPVLNGPGRRVDIDLDRANDEAEIEGMDRLPAQTDYFVGLRESWHTGVPNFQRLAYRSVYRGIDVVYSGTRGGMNAEFVVKPGADPEQIRLQFRGAEQVRITAGGDLVVSAAGAEFVQKKPLIYQAADRTQGGSTPVAGQYYRRPDGTVGIRAGGVKHALPLVVNLSLTYSSFLGGRVTDTITAVKSDSRGRMVVAGATGNSDLESTPDALQIANFGTTNCFVAIFDLSKPAPTSLAYLTYFGGERNDSPTAMYIDSSDHIYLTGTTTSSTFPLAGNSVQTKLSLGTTSAVFLPDAFVAEIAPNQFPIYSTYLGGTGTETPYGVGADQSGFIYVAGSTDSTDYPVTTQAYQASLTGNRNLFLAKLDPNSTSINYSTYLGGEATDDLRGLAVAPSGLLYFGGTTSSVQFPMAGASYSTVLKGAEGLVIGEMDMNQSGPASLIYSTHLGGSTLDELRGVALDANGKLLVTGWTLSTDFPTTATAFQRSGGATGSAFVTRVNPAAGPAAFIEYSTYLGGTGGDVAYGVTSDAAANLYVTGYTLSTDFPVTPDAAQPANGGGIAAFLVKLNPGVAGSGALVYGSYFGGTGVHYGQGVALAPNGTIFVGGTTTPDFQATGFQPDFAGGTSDGFVLAVK